MEHEIKRPDCDEKSAIECLSDGSYLHLLPFLKTILKDYPDKTDYRDFSQEEPVKIALNIYHFIKVIEDPNE